MKKRNGIKKIIILGLVFTMILSTVTLAGLAKPYRVNPSKEILINKLKLHAPSSVMEGKQFLVVVTANDRPVERALVVFLNGSFFTDRNGTVILRAPMVEHTTAFEITASKPGYIPDRVWIKVIDNHLPELTMEYPSPVMEGERFMVIVTAGNETVDNARVVFCNRTYYTNSSGIAILVAPYVDHDTTEMIYVTKEGYRPCRGRITILDNPMTYGWIYGTVCDTSFNPLGNASVCAIQFNETVDCTSTDGLGRYILYVPIGTYEVEASKPGYVTEVQRDVLVRENEAVEVNFLLEPIAQQPSVVFVDDDFNENTTGWGYDHFDMIQDGIDAVAEQGTVHVEMGTYFENIVIDKEIYLIGHDKSLVYIDGSDNDHVVNILADSVVIGGFTIQNSGSYKAGLLIEDSDYVAVLNNIIRDCTFGIALEFSHNCLLQRNLVMESSQIGILLEYSSSNAIIENTIEESGISSIHILGDSSDDNNILYHNNIMGGGWYTAYDTQNNTWDNGYPSGGNYWSDYTGDDEFSGPNQNIPGPDGIGDTPYDIPGGDNQDRYPLMQPYS